MYDRTKIYLGCQIEQGKEGICFGVAVDASFILISRYLSSGDTEPVLFRHR